MYFVCASVVALAGIVPHAAANNFIAKSLGSNMVLQRDQTTYLTGYSGRKGAEVHVEFNSEQFVGYAAEQASETGGGFYWNIALPSMPGSFTKYSLNVTSSAGEQEILENVLFGDVFLCGGQSNMQFSVPGEFDAEAEILAADRYPNIRLFTVGQDYNLPQATAPLDDLVSVIQGWTEASSASVAYGDEWAVYFSAVCWNFAKHVYDDILLQEVPVGAISSNWGGTVVEAWAPPAVIDHCYGAGASQKPHVAMVRDNADQAALGPLKGSAGEQVDPNAPSVLYNTMIYPFRDTRVKGAIWYQGESNVGSAPGVYPCMQTGMVNSWRELMGASDFGFMYTQISTWDAGGTGAVADFRLQQFTALWEEGGSRTGMITAADLGDPESPYDPIHPRNKTEVGRRLSLAASSVIYGNVVPHLGPMVAEVLPVQGPAGSGLRLNFDEFSCGEGIHLEAVQECPRPEVCGEVLLQYPKKLDRSEWVQATVEVVDRCAVAFFPIDARSEQVLALSYGWNDYPLMSIYNSLGAPLIPVLVTV